MSKLKKLAEEALEQEKLFRKTHSVETAMGKLAKAVLVMHEALEAIEAKKGFTLLHDCCVNNSCIEVPGESHCTHQLGVWRGFGECGSMAENALADAEKIVSDKCN